MWDTVGAIGISEYDDEDRRIDAFRFVDLDLNNAVQYGFHAVSLDEQRADFTPTLWNPRNGVTQTLFPGVHADVGGGYPTINESGLSDGALVWLQQQLNGVPGGNAVRFGARPDSVKPNACGIAHQPWLYSPYKEMAADRVKPRVFPNGWALRIDASVNTRRIQGSVRPDPSQPTQPYSPGNIPLA